MEKIAKDFKSFENSIAKYIFKKYIMTHPKTTTNTEENTDENTDENAADTTDEDVGDASNSGATAEVNANTSFNSELYKLYIQQIFDLERHSFRILQDDVLKEDLKQMTLADRAYEASGGGKNYNIDDYKSLPDVLRCTFIRKYKHRYYRCKNKIMNDDTDVCKKHENCENIYIDKYNELMEFK